MFEQKVFWKEDFEGKAKDGIMFRSFELKELFNNIENNGEEVVGVMVEGNNLNILINDNEKITV